MSARLDFVQEWVDLVPHDIRDVYRDEAIGQRLVELLTPHLTNGFYIELIGPEDSGFAERHEGMDGFLAGWDTWSSPYESYLYEAALLEEIGAVVLVDGVQTATLPGAAEPIAMRVSTLWCFEGERLASVEFHLDKDRAHSIAAERSQS